MSPGRDDAAESVGFIVDASVGIKLYFPEPLSDRAHALLRRAGARPRVSFFVPDLFYVECANIFWKRVRHSGYSVEGARRDMADIRKLEVVRYRTADLAEDAL